MADLSLDELVAQHDAVSSEIDRLGRQLEMIKSAIRDRGLGAHQTSDGREVVVSPAHRRFNLNLACSFLNPIQLESCRLVGYDPKKVKDLLPPVLLDKAMESTGGPFRVSIK